MKTVSLAIPAVLVFYSPAAAYIYPDDNGGVISIGGGSPITQARNITIYNRFIEANANPNDTRSVTFAPLNQGGFQSGSNAVDESIQWTWRVNVTDVPVPDAQPAYPSEQPDFVDPHIANTAYDLSWPEGANISAALNDTNVTVCATILVGWTLPNVTNLYTDNDTESSACEPILGADCVTAILGASRSKSGSCQFPETPWRDIPECASTLGADPGRDQYGMGTVNVWLNPTTPDETSPNNISSPAELRGDPISDRSPPGTAFFSRSLNVHNGTNTTSYDQSADRLHVMVLSITPQVGVMSNRAMCMRVRTAELPTNATNPDGTPTGSPSETSSPAAAAGPTANGVGMTVGVGGLVALFALL
ncbi:hypothetical protein K431DRAFT_315546 [Polychaeton citri CBS 116435]|uniref:Uncharacterized protein n=1 Tax=Polychaeton citri CBS 116435 TaxID=1314669 RepID=A0A9P4UKQ1_9PEZI|nr:hypothetical protein K431DRAFT_315546 [Polychaeton citri CBS 116435]